MRNMRDKWWTLPMLMLGAGFLSRRFTVLFTRLTAVRSEGADGAVSVQTPPWHGTVMFLFNLALIVAVALMVRRMMGRKAALKGAAAMTAFQILVLILEQTVAQADYRGFVLVYNLYLPGEADAVVLSTLWQHLPGDPSIWLYAALHCCFPLIYVLCAKRALEGERTE